MPLEAGTRVGRYTITRLIAQGGMAEVYRAEQDLARGISRPVAVKVIRPEYSESPEFREMFLDEARTACTLSHPNIVHIYEVGESDGGQLFMVMELVSGETLATIARTMRAADERFADEALFAIGVACCSALEAVHALKVEGGTVNLVHRDVSPHNLLLSATGALKLIDFGIAKAATNRNLTMPGVTKGKAGYFSPEQAMGRRLDGRSDLFSLGVTLYKLASGGTPFDEHGSHAERHAALVRGQWKDLNEAFPGLPSGFAAAVTRALALKPEQRFQTAREMREALERAAFDARLRVGQSSLLGYVDEEGGITVDGGARSSAFAGPGEDGPTAKAKEPRRAPVVPSSNVVSSARPALATPMPAPRATERLNPVVRVPAPSRSALTRPVVLGAFVASLAVGGLGTLLFLERTPTAPGVEAKPTVAAPPTRVLVPDIDVEPEQPPPPRPERVVQPVKVVSTPVRVERAPEPKVEAKAEPEKKAEPPKEPVIPPGEGQLRIKVINAGRATLTVDDESWGEPPVNRKVSSGAFHLTVRADGRSWSSKVTVLPDQTTAVTLDAETGKWTSRSQGGGAF